MMTAAEAAEVDAFFRASTAWAIATASAWRPGPTWDEKNRARKVALRNAASAKRHAAKLKRTPPWADQKAVRAVYERARALTVSTGEPHHVDHIFPLQGELVSGLHVADNLQVLPGVDNMRKNNRYEVA